MLSARQKIERQMASPALVRQYHALTRLRSTVSIMHTGAHPDDEQSGMLAYLRYHLGMHVMIACSTRGEGGQNALGEERGAALGLMRTREMEEAARILDSDLIWLGHGIDDPIHDFGFSKDGDSTFALWGEERIVERLVRAYRQFKPDIVIPTFLDVAGQHGHHRAMTRAAETAIELAADHKAYPEHFSEGLQVWQVSKYYLPAWSGGGDYYDDETPPPATTITIKATNTEPATGVDYDRIGEWSRYYHGSQGMGYWPEEPKREWPLHLKLTKNKARAETTITDNLAANLENLAEISGLPAATAEALRDAQDAIDHAISAFPDQEAIMHCLTEAARHLLNVQKTAPENFRTEHGHRISRKISEINKALFEASGIFESAELDQSILPPDAETRLSITLSTEAQDHKTKVQPVFNSPIEITALENTRNRRNFLVKVPDNAPFSPIYEPYWFALGGNGQAYVQIVADFNGYSATSDFDLVRPLNIIPPASLQLEPETLLISTSTPLPDNINVKAVIQGNGSVLTFPQLPPFHIKALPEINNQFAIKISQKPENGLYHFTPQIDGRDAYRLRTISYPHIGETVYRETQYLDIIALDLKIPQSINIGYIGGGADRTALWLRRMGFKVHDLTADDLSGNLSRFDTIIVGIFAFGIRKDLAASTAKLHDYVYHGGNLVTLYHRPIDGWDAEITPVKKIIIGTPSLRWRVTNPNAEIRFLNPQHELLTGPNIITEQDFEGWHKERGLYFASHWDDAYEPLFSMHDPNEEPLTGSLLTARIGKGRHTHTSLVLHHQMDKLVPGAFRLVANLVQPA